MTRWNRSTRGFVLLTRVFVLLVIGSLATSAVAQPAAAPKKRATKKALDGASAHFKAAEAAKARGDYKTAVDEYLAAHELLQDPEFFFDVGEAYQLAGDEPNALTYYQKYLDLEPRGRGAAAARTAVLKLRRSIADKESAAKRAADDEAKRKAAEDARRKADEDAQRKADEDAARRAAWFRDPIALALLGAGVAATGVGTGFLLSAQSLGHDAEQAKTYPQMLALKDRASRRGTLGLITGGVGLALVGGGVTWILLHRDSREQRTVTGWLEPGGGGLAISGPF
jgi:tetratricopeptide (TPR) repeat protein